MSLSFVRFTGLHPFYLTPPCFNGLSSCLIIESTPLFYSLSRKDSRINYKLRQFSFGNVMLTDGHFREPLNSGSPQKGSGIARIQPVPIPHSLFDRHIQPLWRAIRELPALQPLHLWHIQNFPPAYMAIHHIDGRNSNLLILRNFLFCTVDNIHNAFSAGPVACIHSILFPDLVP